MAKLTITPLGNAPIDFEVSEIAVDGIKIAIEFLARMGDHPERTVAIKKGGGTLICKVDRVMTIREQREFWND